LVGLEEEKKRRRQSGRKREGGSSGEGHITGIAFTLPGFRKKKKKLRSSLNLGGREKGEAVQAHCMTGKKGEKGGGQFRPAASCSKCHPKGGDNCPGASVYELNPPLLGKNRKRNKRGKNEASLLLKQHNPPCWGCPERGEGLLEEKGGNQ